MTIALFAPDRAFRRRPLLRARVLVPAAVAGFLAAASAPALASPAPATSAPAGSALRVAVDGVVDAGAVGATATADDGEHAETVTAGLAARDPRRPMRADDQVEIGSNTKTFLATVALQLVGEHRLTLTDSVQRWLPGVVPGGDAITVRMLLNHTSGIFNYTDDEAWGKQALADPERVWQPEELVAVAVAHPPYFAPGAGWTYSNTNYQLVGMILKKVTGADPALLVARRITAPLRLRHTYLPLPGQSTAGRHRAGSYMVLFNADGTRRYTDTAAFNLSWAGYAGAMISTNAERARFFQALLGGRLLPPAQLAQMRATVSIVPPGQPNPQHAGYGLGLLTLDTPCGTIWGHNGGTLGTSTDSYVSADGTRSATTATITRLDIWQDPKLPAAQQFATATDTLTLATICRMYDRPVPQNGAATPGATAAPAPAARLPLG